MIKQYSFFLAFIIFSNYTICQNPEIKAFNEYNWDIKTKSFKTEAYKGKESIYLENGIALLKGDSLKNGIVDFYVTFTSSRKFVSFYFRNQDSLMYERFYMRPHNAGKIDATQYTPVVNGLSAWQLYYGIGYSRPYYFNFEEWNHLRFVINDNEMDVYINDMSKPVLEVYDLKNDIKKGGLGIGVSRGGAYFADFTYQKIEHPKIFNSNKEIPKQISGTIKNWSVSEAFAINQLDKVYDLKKMKNWKSISWKNLKSEYSGTINLAQVSAVSDSSNTVLAKFIINSEKRQIKKLDFGFSDSAKIYINHTLMYSGSKTFRSRDYRYLGTIGYFESIYLDLKKGKNEVVFAISETFGGWGVKAQLENTDGIKLD